MYVRGSEHTLVSVGERPNLESTERFQTVLETVPYDLAIPARIIKLGFLTDQLQVKESGYEIQFSVKGIKEQTTAQVPPRTLAEIPQFLYDISDGLPEKRKRATGTFCDATDLNRPPQDGTPPEVLCNVVSDTYDGCLDFIKEVTEKSTTTSSSTEESRATRATSAESRSHPFAGRANRLTGKNPFADPDRLKNTGLHQGGG